MKRKALICIFIAVLMCIYSDARKIKLHGRYSGGSLFGEGFYFLPNDSFHFGGFYCTYGLKGKGHYSVKHQILCLHFAKDSIHYNQFTVPSFIKKERADSILTIELTVEDERKEPLVNTFVCLAINDSSAAIAPTITDFDGHATISISRPHLPLQLNVRYMEYRIPSIIFTTCGSYTGGTVLAQDHSYKAIKEGTVWKFKMRKVREDSFSLKRYGSFYTYRRNNTH